jgi:hypothetical protein
MLKQAPGLSTRVARCFLAQFTSTDKNIPNDHKITKWTYNIPNGLFQRAIKIYQHSLFQGPPKYTQIVTFGLKIYIPSGNPAFY